MVSPAQWDRELIAYLAAECTALRNSEVVGVRWLSPANQARVLGDSLDVIPVANPPRLRQGQRAFINPLWALSILWLFCVPPLERRRLRRCLGLFRIAGRKNH
jgi:hypothetical protein